MFKSNYDRARKAIPPCRRECAPRKYNSKWRKKENIELIKKAVNAYKKNSDLTDLNNEQTDKTDLTNWTSNFI